MVMSKLSFQLNKPWQLMRIHAFHHLYQTRLATSTKSFNARGSRVKRCQYCQVAVDYCVCQYQPTVESKVAVMLLLSANEVFKPSNTGRLILDTIQQGFAYQWSRTEPKREMLELLSNPKFQPILVFPKQYVEDESRIISQPNSIQCSDKVPLLIFIDGSWREARKIFNKSEYLSKLPVLSIEPMRLSQYMMRHSENEQHLATAEVASIVLDQLGETQASNILSGWFDVFRESYMLSKSRFYSDFSRPTLQQFLVDHKDCLDVKDVNDLS